MTRRSSTSDASALEWFKSSYSASDSNDCVEVAASPGIVHVRDSKNAHGPRLALNAAAWAGFVADVAAR